ncbi:MAG: thymidine phosphorylase, partial [Candidatus Altarchaeaceae archaeon]
GNVVDKHSIGGVAGNRTTMLSVPMVASYNLKIPKTSSRAITSASGTADTMEVLSKVVFEKEKIKEIVDKANGCIVWGGAINLAPSDDKIIKVEYPLSIDPDSQMLASVIAKKKSVNAKYLLVDIPVGRGAKINSIEKGKELGNKFLEIGERLGIKTRCLITDGSSPIGNGIGAALEARDVLIALNYEKFKNKKEIKIPYDLINKSIDITANIFEMVFNDKKNYREIAEEILKKKALKKMKEIIELQEGNPEITLDDIKIGDKFYEVKAEYKGKIKFISNWKISQIARAAGSPYDKSAGIYLNVSVGDFVRKNETLFTIYSSSSSKLQNAIELAERLNPVEIGGAIIEKVE